MAWECGVQYRPVHTHFSCVLQKLRQDRSHGRCTPLLWPVRKPVPFLQKEEADGSTAASTPRLEDAVRRQRLRALRARVVALTQVAAGKNPETNEAECSKVKPRAATVYDLFDSARHPDTRVLNLKLPPTQISVPLKIS